MTTKRTKLDEAIVAVCDSSNNAALVSQEALQHLIELACEIDLKNKTAPRWLCPDCLNQWKAAIAAEEQKP